MKTSRKHLHMAETRLKRLIRKMAACAFLDAMSPEFKSANAELLKAMKMNDKSGAVPHADLEAINKAMKANDAAKAGEALKKVQLQFAKAERKLDDDVKSITEKLEASKRADADAKAKVKSKKALGAIFGKLKTLVGGLAQSPKNASRLTALTDKVKDYGDLSKRASQIITMVSGNKDASKQIDMLKKAVDAAEGKYKKDVAASEKEAQKAKDALEVAKMQQKVTQGKKDAFTKERLYIANAVKNVPQGDLRQKREGGGDDYKSELEKVYGKFLKLRAEAENEANKISNMYKEQKFDYEGYSQRIKKLIWSAYESIPAEYKEAASIVRAAYKFYSYTDRNSLLNELVKAKEKINSKGGDYKKYLGPIIEEVKKADEMYKNSRVIGGMIENDAWNVNHYLENGQANEAIAFILANVPSYKQKIDAIEEEYSKCREKAKKAGESISRNIRMYHRTHSNGQGA